MKDLLFLDSMLTPKIITFIYWLALIGAVLAGINSLWKGDMLGLIYIIGGVIFARVFSELTIVLFKIYENIKKMADKE